ncbi:hypothetical protein CF319_g2859 [Tilletia indica]|nr:hypothetical protein CF319_g2859 [Tilletia indica]
MATPSQTVISSPFFRPEILSAYARDSLTAADYPDAHAASLFEAGSEEEGGEGASTALTPANVQALQDASQALASHLVLIDRESQSTADLQHKLQAATLRSHLAVTLMLLNEHTRALAQLNFASDSLRPPRPPKTKQANEVDGEDHTQSSPAKFSPSPEVDKLRITLWILTEKACLALGKTHEADRVQRWRKSLELRFSMVDELDPTKGDFLK